MSVNLRGKWLRFCVLLISVSAGFSSCRTAREMPAERLKLLPAEKLISLAEQNAFDYNDLTIRRIQVQFSNSSAKTSFRATVRAVKNESILASISKMNIPLGRVLLTPDSITYVNYIDKNYFVEDYSLLSDYFGFSLNFETIQAIISNNVFAGRDNILNFSGITYDSSVENGRYVLQASSDQNGLKTKGVFSRMRSPIYAGRVEQPESEQEAIRKMYFNRRTYLLERLQIDDNENSWKLEVDFSDFVKIEKKDYPGTIDVKMTSPGEVVEMKIKLNGFSTEKTESAGLNIPGTYEKIHLK